MDSLTEEQALPYDLDTITTLNRHRMTEAFMDSLLSRRSQIEAIVSRHLGIQPSGLVLSQQSEWISGEFNICVPINILDSRRSTLPSRVLMRFPIPFNVGECFSPGNVDEKLRCEAATYIWLRRSCPSIPIPRLLGTGFEGGHSFTAIQNESWLHQITWQLRRGLAWLSGDTLAPYFAHQRKDLADVGYLLVEYVERGDKLSSSWPQHYRDEHRRANLYRSLAKIMLSLARISLPRIGSWTLNDRGIISLTNRPLLNLTLIWGRHSIPIDIPRNKTYTSAEDFVSDMIYYQDNRMRYQPNSMISTEDGVHQVSALAILRALIARFWAPAARGPFLLTLSSLTQSSILVDDDWNITCLIDLQFAPVCPAQMAHVPVWLSGCAGEVPTESELEEHKAVYKEFVSIIEREETALEPKQAVTENTISPGKAFKYSTSLYRDWRRDCLWYVLALKSISACPAIFTEYIQPRHFGPFDLEDNGEALAKLWDQNALRIIDSKVNENNRYMLQVDDIFAAAEADLAIAMASEPEREGKKTQ